MNRAAFWALVRVNGGGECWPWLGCTSIGGYGRFFKGARGRVGEYAHRSSWQIHYGPIPDGFEVCHQCDVRYPVGSDEYRKCVNPAHLFIGTHKENQEDMKRKGRSTPGERNRQAKLTSTDVALIRRLSAEGLTQERIAARVGVRREAIGKIQRGERWSHLAVEVSC